MTSTRAGSRGVTGIVISLVIFLSGCAGSGSGGPGADLMKAGRYDEAVAVLETASAARPKDAKLLRNLGIARLKNGDAKGAAESLSAAQSLNDKDPTTLFFLGRAHETEGANGAAADAYGRYLALKPDDAEVRTRLRLVNLKRIRSEIEDAVKNESNRRADIPENTLAVMEFQNLTSASELEALSRGLQAMLTGDLAQVRQFTVLERERLTVLLDEVKLGSMAMEVKPPSPAHDINSVEGVKERLAQLPGADGQPYFRSTTIDASTGVAWMDAVRGFQKDHGLAVDGKMGPQTRAALGEAYDRWLRSATISVPAMDKTSVPRAGRLLGARLLVQGTVSGSLDGPLRLDAGVTESTTGELKGTGADAGGPLAEVLRMEKEIVFGLLDGLAVHLSDDEKDAIGRLPTKNVSAFMAWSEGLLFEDRGRMDLARGSYSKALALDPGFQPARRSLDGVSGTDTGLSQTENRLTEQSLAEGGGGGGEGGVRDRLDLIGAINGGGLMPGKTGDDQLNPAVTPVGVTGGSATVIVTGEVPR